MATEQRCDGQGNATVADTDGTWIIVDCKGCSLCTSDSGYRDCACRDCFNVAIGHRGAFCDGCVNAGCPDYQGERGMSQECQRPDAYGGE